MGVLPHNVETANGIVKIDQYRAVAGSTNFTGLEMLSSVHISFSIHISLLAQTKKLVADSQMTQSNIPTIWIQVLAQHYVIISILLN